MLRGRDAEQWEAGIQHQSVRVSDGTASARGGELHPSEQYAGRAIVDADSDGEGVEECGRVCTNWWSQNRSDGEEVGGCVVVRGE